MPSAVRLSTLHGHLSIGTPSCNKFIGEPTIYYRFVGCAVSPVQLENGTEESRVKKSYNVPSHNIEIRVTEVDGHDQATLVRLSD